MQGQVNNILIEIHESFEQFGIQNLMDTWVREVIYETS